MAVFTTHRQLYKLLTLCPGQQLCSYPFRSAPSAPPLPPISSPCSTSRLLTSAPARSAIEVSAAEATRGLSTPPSGCKQAT